MGVPASGIGVSSTVASGEAVAVAVGSTRCCCFCRDRCRHRLSRSWSNHRHCRNWSRRFAYRRCRRRVRFVLHPHWPVTINVADALLLTPITDPRIVLAPEVADHETSTRNDPRPLSAIVRRRQNRVRRRGRIPSEFDPIAWRISVQIHAENRSWCTTFNIGHQSRNDPQRRPADVPIRIIRLHNVIAQRSQRGPERNRRVPDSVGCLAAQCRSIWPSQRHDLIRTEPGQRRGHRPVVFAARSRQRSSTRWFRSP